MKTLQAFHGSEAVKQKYLDRVRLHREAGNLIQGTGWNNGRGCAVGCTLESYDHTRYPVELGLPEWLAHLEDRIFEGLLYNEAMPWPERFLVAIPVGADVDLVRHRLAIRRLDRLIEVQGRAVETATEERGVRATIEQAISVLRVVRSCHEAELGGSVCDWSAARSAAESAARSAAESAAESAAKSAAKSAARSAMWSAWSARLAVWSAWSARSAAESAAWSAESAESVWRQEADDLIELLEAA